MRIAIVNSLRVCGGGEKWLVRQAAAWQERGHQIAAFCQPGSGLHAMLAEGELKAVPVRMRHDVSIPSILALAGALRRFRPAVALCCNERAFRLTVPASLAAGRPGIVYRNGLTATFKNRSVNRVLFRFAACMVVNAGELRREMAAFGWIPADRLRFIANGIDTSCYTADDSARRRIREELGAAPGAVVAAMLARLTEDKGQIEVIEAFGELRSRRPAAELWLAGEGSLRPRLEVLARENGVADRVRFLGFRRDVPALLQAVDLVVVASHREGLANTVLEAMAAARPVIGTAVGGIPDVLTGGETGELIPPGDPPALAAALDRLLVDPELRRTYGEAGRRMVEERFPLEGETRQWLALFDQVQAKRWS